MSIQNLERRVDQTILTIDNLFQQYEIREPSEQLLMIRLFKRFYFITVKQKYGYMKNV
jgi:hypothetical protein